MQYVIALSKSNKQNLVLVQKVIFKEGKYYTQGYWVTPEQAKQLQQAKKFSEPLDYDKIMELAVGKKEDREEAMEDLREHGLVWDEVAHTQQNWLKANKALREFLKNGEPIKSSDIHVTDNAVKPLKSQEIVKHPATEDVKKQAELIMWNMVKKFGKEKFIEIMSKNGVTWPSNQWLTITKACKDFLINKILEDKAKAVPQNAPEPVLDTSEPIKTPEPVVPEPVKQDTNLTVLDGKTYKINQELLDKYAALQGKSPLKPEENGVLIAVKALQDGLSPAQFYEKLSYAYEVIRAKNRVIVPQAERDKRLLDFFGTKDPNKDLIDSFYRANDILKNEAVTLVDASGREVKVNFDIIKDKDSDGFDCWKVLELEKWQVYNIKEDLKKIGARWDKGGFWKFPMSMSDGFMKKILEVYRYGNGTSDSLREGDTTQSGIDGSKPGQLTGLVRKFPVRDVKEGEYGRIIPTRAKVFTGDDKLNTLVSSNLALHQIHGVNLGIESIENYGAFLLSDGTGAGKTRQELAAAHYYAERGNTVLLMVPNAGVMGTSFKEDAESLGIDNYCVALTNDPSVQMVKSSDFKLEKGKINLISYNNLDKLTEYPDYTILDEAHYLKNYGSARSDLGKKIVENSKGALYATATPMDKATHIHYLEKLGIFKKLSKTKVMEKLGYKYVRVWKDVHEWKRVVTLDQAVQKLDDFFSELTDLGMMVKREVGMDDTTVSFENIKLPKEAHDELKKLEKIYADNVAVMLMAQRRYQEPYKVPKVMDMINEELNDGRQVVVFADRVNASEIEGAVPGTIDLASDGTITTLVKALENDGVNVSKIYGDNNVPIEQSKFQNSSTQVAIVTPNKGAVGLNLDDDMGIAPRTMIVVTPPFSASSNVQMAGRVCRMNTKSNVKIRFVFADSAVEDWNRAIISEKMKILHAVVQGSTEKLQIS